MSSKPVNKTVNSIMEAWEKRVISDWPAIDYGPDDAVFTKAYGATIRAHASPKSSPKTRSPLELLRDYSNAWAEYGVSCPDLVFQTRSQGRHFYASCLAAVGTYSLGTHSADSVDGMCIARVMGVNLIWPEE